MLATCVDSIGSGQLKCDVIESLCGDVFSFISVIAVNMLFVELGIKICGVSRRARNAVDSICHVFFFLFEINCRSGVICTKFDNNS